MLKSLAAWVLNSYIGEYFGNINSDQLSIALHNGEVELENLPLRQDVIKHFGLPVEVVNGYIGKISLKIPVYRLKSEPWVISIDELFLIARPITDFKYNDEEEKQVFHDYKMSKLDSLESKWKSIRESEKEAQSYYQSSYSAWMSYGQSFASDIIENLQLKINSVHIRFEDDSTIPNCAFACGLIIRNLSAHSTDENGAPKYVNCDSSDSLRKLVQLEGFSVYWDSNVSLFSHLELDEVVNAMRILIDKNIDVKGHHLDHKYIISPICGKALLNRNCSKEPLKTEPRNVVDLQIEQCPITLTSIQYKNILEWSDSFNRANILWKYRKWRPKVPVIGNAILWWKFAVDSHLESYRLKKSRNNWQFIVGRAKDVISYCDVYYTQLTHPETLNKSMRELKDRIESEFSIEELSILREVVFKRCDKDNSNQEPNLSYWSWYNWFTNWSGSNENYDSFDSEKLLSPDDEVPNELSFSEDDSILTYDDIFAKVNFMIQHVSFTLLSLEGFNEKLAHIKEFHNSKSLMGFEFSKVRLEVETRPRTSSHQLDIALDDLNVLLIRADNLTKIDDNAVKMATASLSGMNLHTHITLDDIQINGSVCGLQVLDLVTEPSNNKHKRVVSIGIDIDMIVSETVNSRNKNTGYNFETLPRISQDTPEKALSFSVRRLIQDNILEVNSKMASVCYVHSVKLVDEFTSCLSDFQACISAVSDKIKSAATEVALGIITKGRTNLENLYSNKNLKINHSSTNGFIDDLRLNIHLETPVIVFPIAPSNYNVMVANLGQISITNDKIQDLQSQILFAKIKDLSLYSLDISKKIGNGKDLESFNSKELYSCENFGVQILQETMLNISIEKKTCTHEFDGEQDDESGLNMLNSKNVVLPYKKHSFPIKNHNKEFALNIDIPNISIRVSYNDFLMFWQIFNTLTFQHNDKPMHKKISRPNSLCNSHNSVSPNIKQLKEFTLLDNNSSPNNTSQTNQSKKDDDSKLNSNLWTGTSSSASYTKFSLIEIKVHNGTLCIIDDCNKTDLPFLEFSSKDLHLFQHNNNSSINGFSQITFHCNYFNRALSSWEPFIEPWSFQLAWNLEERNYHVKTIEVPKKKLSVILKSKNIFDLNITSSFLEVYNNVSKSWFDDWENLKSTKSLGEIAFRHRTPFVPFTLRNETGCNLKFHIVVQDSETSSILEAHQLYNKKGNKFNCPKTNIAWINVEPNEVIPFSFQVSTKMRHLDSHLNRTHKIVVEVEGWKAVFPVSVDKVGTFFRDALPIDRVETGRIVFSISLDQTFGKLITIRSALLISNRISNSVEIKFENTEETLYLNSNAILAVPLRFVRNKMYVYPCDVGVNTCKTPISWEHVRRCNEITTEMQNCSPISVTKNQHSSYSTSSPYRYCVMVERNNFPLDIATQGPGLQSYKAQPAHTITLCPPLQIINLLPYELRFHIITSLVIATIKPGQECSVHFINVLEPFNIEFAMDDYPQSNHITINPGPNRDYIMPLELTDSRKRQLILNVSVSLITNWPSALVITIYAPIWILNKTGLPLIFKQEEASNEAAGQLEEHEKGRSISPLLFSFTEHDAPHSITLRLGKSRGEFPRWSHSFYPEKGTWYRRVRIGHKNSKDDIYELVIDVRNGRGRYRDTRIVTVSQFNKNDALKNHKLEVEQKLRQALNDDLFDVHQKVVHNNFEFQLIIKIDCIGFSIINKYNEELMYIFLQNSICDFCYNNYEWNLNCSVQNFQICNQLREAEKPVVLYVQQNNVSLPAILFSVHKLNIPKVDEAELFKLLQVSIKDLTFNLEEVLLLKMFEFLNLSQYIDADDESDLVNDSENQPSNQLAIASYEITKTFRYYFSIFMITLSQIKLSVFTTPHLIKHLQRLKKKFGIKLIRFEDATIQLLPYKKEHLFETKKFIFDSIYEHYRSELKSQAAKILGSVDFLGNPLGFVNNVTDGINELINEGSFGGLIWNIAHGISDSTAKFTSVLSDGLGVVSMDQKHQERRKRIKQESNYLSAGVKGLGVGLLGGITSIVEQTYEGAVKHGVSGIFFGFGKGVVGTITKPAVGMLDFASSAASAVRETSRKLSNTTENVQRVRPPRVCSIDGLLLSYDINQAKGQEFFYEGKNIPDREDDEVFISIEEIERNFLILITNEKLRLIRTKDIGLFENKIELIINFENLIECDVISNLTHPEIEKVYFIVIITEESFSFERAKQTRKKIRCKSEHKALKILDQINYAKHAFEERKYTINNI